MAEIFEVCTEAADGTTLTGRVQYRSPDGYGFSQGPAFGLQLIMDAWQSGVGVVSAATETEFNALFDMYLGKKVRVDEEGYLLAEGSTEVREPRVKAKEFYKDQLDPYGGKGFADGTHYIVLAPQADEFARRTAEIIVSWKIVEDGTTDFDEGDAADFTLQVSDPRYLAHLTENTSFLTAFTGHLPY